MFLKFDVPWLGWHKKDNDRAILKFDPQSHTLDAFFFKSPIGGVDIESKLLKTHNTWRTLTDPKSSLWANTILVREPSGSVVECLTQDRGAAGSSLTGVTALCPWARHINPSLVLVQPRKTCPFITERLLMGHKEPNQTKTKKPWWFKVLL